MPPKRKNGEDNDTNAREKKKKKVAIARSINVQSNPSASFQSAGAGPSRVGIVDGRVILNKTIV
jgi:hypothetical protein